jgi:predicted O-linked N-acetylglucosamine transferase (SPINDLY family)
LRASCESRINYDEVVMDERAVHASVDPAVEDILTLEKELWAVPKCRAAALDLLRQAMRSHPGNDRLLTRHAVRARSLADWRDGAPNIDALLATGAATSMLYFSDDPALHHAAALAYQTKRLVGVESPYLHSPAAARGVLHIGYISSDFRDHVVSQVTAELFERHDRTRVSVTGYSLRASDGSMLRRRIESGFDRFVDLSTATDAEAAERIHADGTDILIDLNGYRTGARIGILARRPAPIQVNFFGFAGTMAAGFIDYIIGDSVIFGGGAASYFSERLVVMPDTYWPNDTRKTVTMPPPTRHDVGLPSAGFVYCCFNLPHKITPGIFGCWMRLLKQTEGAVLWLLAPWGGVAGNLRREAAARGVDPQRLIFARMIPHADNLARLSLADLALDTLPYGAHATAADALWMGVPTVTCLGKTFPGRVGASLLTAIGLPELITCDLDSYEMLALRLARDANLLSSLKQRLAANRLTAPLFDCSRYARHLERAYAMMWSIHCANGDTAPADVRRTNDARAPLFVGN